MKAFVVTHYGKDGVQARGLTVPTVGHNDVLVKVHAASVTPLDTMVRDGDFKQLLKYRTPFVLVHADAGGLGSTVVQLAKHLDAHVATTANGPGAELVRNLGADVMIDYTTKDFTDAISG